MYGLICNGDCEKPRFNDDGSRDIFKIVYLLSNVLALCKVEIIRGIVTWYNMSDL